MDDYKQIEDKMKKPIEGLKKEFKTIRAGRANPAILERIMVEYYGVPTPINQLAGISIPEARVIIIQPWDASAIKEIEKGIAKADLGITPNSDGKVIRLVFPQLTEERRKELTKTIKKMGEEAKVIVRNARREALDIFKAQQKAGEMTEDDLKDDEKKVQGLTDKYILEIDEIVELKEQEILEV